MGLNLLTAVVTGGLSSGPRGFTLRLALAAGVILVAYRWHFLRDGYFAALLLLALPAIYQFQFAGGRINGDGVFYYSYVRSIWKDGDVNFENEYRHYDLADRRDLAQPTLTGYRRTIFSIGPAVVWSPFFGLGELYGRALAALGRGVDSSGYGPTHRNAVALGSFFYGFAAVLLVQSMLRRYFTRGTAFAASAVLWLGTNLYWYMVQQPTMSHAASTSAAALFLWLWDGRPWRARAADALALGLVGGLAMSIRWQNGVLFLLPALGFFALVLERSWRFLGRAGALGAGAFFGFLPQMLAWKSIFGVYLLSDPPHGEDFLRLDHPFLLETLFSSRHGILSWTPVLWLGYLGLLPLLKRFWATVAPLTLILLFMTYVNMCSGDWWAGGSFSNRRFDSVLPILAFGLAASFERLHTLIARRPVAVAGGVLGAFVLWNLLFMEQYRRNMIPRDDTVSFVAVVSNSAQVLFEKTGAPFSWPANWLVARRYGISPQKYDLLVGRYLFYRQNNLGGVVDLGEDDGGLLGDGWRRPEQREGVWVRQIRDASARLFAPLDVPEDLVLTVRASARPDPLEVALLVNGVLAGRLRVTPGFEDYSLFVPRERWESGLNTVDFEMRKPEDAYLLVDRVVFTRRGAPSAENP